MARRFLASDGLAKSGVDPVWLAEMLPRVDPTSLEIREARRWFRAMWARGIVAVAMPWAIYFTPQMVDRYENGSELPQLAQLLVHELTHIEQLRRLGVLRHVGQYTADYVRGRLQRVGHWDAYRAIRLEVEARAVAQLTQGDPR